MADLLFDHTTPIGKLRSLIPDRTPITNLMKQGEITYLFADGDLQSYLDLNNGNIRRALADALETLGTNEMMVGKVITTQDLATDASKLMGQYLARAKAQRAIADAESGPVSVALEEDGLFAIQIIDGCEPWQQPVQRVTVRTPVDTSTEYTVLFSADAVRPVGLRPGYARYVCPTEPTTWLDGDEWIDNS